MKELVVTIGAGKVSALHMDEFDLGFLGPKTVTRASEIVFNTKTQLWDVRVPSLNDAGFVVTQCSKGFTGYDVARMFEVEWLQACKVRDIPATSPRGMDIGVSIRLMYPELATPM